MCLPYVLVAGPQGSASLRTVPNVAALGANDEAATSVAWEVSLEFCP
jgi:hypothetical protein